MIKYKVFLQSYSHDLRPLRNFFSRFHVKPGLRSTVGKHSVKFPNCSSFIFWILPVAVQWVLRRFRAASFVIVVVSALMSTLCSLKSHVIQTNKRVESIGFASQSANESAWVEPIGKAYRIWLRITEYWQKFWRHHEAYLNFSLMPNLRIFIDIVNLTPGLYYWGFL